jgi:hypothetical protein
MQNKVTNKLMTKEQKTTVAKGMEGFLTGTLIWITGRDVFNKENVIIFNFV